MQFRKRYIYIYSSINITAIYFLLEIFFCHIVTLSTINSTLIGLGLNQDLLCERQHSNVMSRCTARNNRFTNCPLPFTRQLDFWIYPNILFPDLYMCKADFTGYFANFLFMIMKLSTDTFIRVDGQSNCCTNCASNREEIVLMGVTRQLVSAERLSGYHTLTKTSCC